MRFSLIIWTLLGALLACGTQSVFAAENEHTLLGRWELTSIGMPAALRRGEYVVFESTTIKMKRDCNEVTLGYSVQGNELNAYPITTTALACDPLHNAFADENRSVYEALQHSRYQIKGDVLRLLPLRDSPIDYRLEFRRVR
jgi:heat shock protein HslJ